MKFSVVYDCWEMLQCPFAEHIVSRLFNSYHYLGGLNGECGGVRGDLALTLPAWAWEKQLVECFSEEAITKQFRAEREYWEKRKAAREVEDMIKRIHELRPVALEKEREADEATARLQAVKEERERLIEIVLGQIDRDIEAIQERERL